MLRVSYFFSLKKHGDDPQEDSTWNPLTAAGSCLELLSQTAPDSVLGLVRPVIAVDIHDPVNCVQTGDQRGIYLRVWLRA